MKRFKVIILIFIVLGVNLIVCINGKDERTNIFSLYKDVTVQHEIYQKINSGISYENLLKFIDDKKIDYSIENNKLKINSMNFDISNRENIKLENSKMVEAFKQIDEKSSETSIKVSYNKDGEKKEVINANKVKYDGENYFLFDNMRLFLYVFSIVMIFLSIVFYFKKK